MQVGTKQLHAKPDKSLQYNTVPLPSIVVFASLHNGENDN